MTKRKSWVRRGEDGETGDAIHEDDEQPERPVATESMAAKLRAGQPKIVNLRCVWGTRLVVPAERTLTRTRYEFDAGQVQSVNRIDAPGLLALEHKQPCGCCGNDPNPPPLKFFERA